jgi:hypothetical protein
MDLTKTFLNEEPIGGLEIESGAIRFSLLKNSSTGPEIITLSEEKLTDKESLIGGPSFVEKLNKFVKKNKIKYVIVSIPSDNVFVKNYNFPAAMPDDKIAGSMKLTMDLQLPKKKEEIYCDWMPTEANENDKKILLSYILKSKADSLLTILKRAGLKVVAIESRASSLARIIKQGKNEALILVEKGKDNYAFSVILNNSVLFSYSAPTEKIGDKFEKEIKKIVNYYDWFNLSIKNLILVGDFSNLKNKKLPLDLIAPETNKIIDKAPKEAKWLIPLGAGLRGLIPRKDDNIISLMDIGTETAYKREKANATANFFIGASIALSLFFVSAFIATWSLILTVQNNYIKQISAFGLLPSAENANSLQEKALDFNSLISQMSQLVQKEPHWSRVVEEVKSKLVADVVVNNLSLPGASETLSITGTAANRTAINNLKRSFESSNFFGNINIPLDNLGKKTDIPFSLTFKIKNSALVYDK